MTLYMASVPDVGQVTGTPVGSYVAVCEAHARAMHRLGGSLRGTNSDERELPCVVCRYLAGPGK